ncbi:MAG: amidohydrolase family protein [Chloroflexi bacterium]|nr:amidohydrolase family protein [Chloroflexota bacterium]
MVKKKEASVKAIKGGMLIDGTGAEPIRNATVVIEGSKIKAVGKGAAIPQAAEVIDAKGKTVMPGLIDAHMHFYYKGHNMSPRTKGEMLRGLPVHLIQSISEGKEVLATGFTMVRDCGGMYGIYIKKAVAEGTITGLPRIVSAGHLISQTAGHTDYRFLPPECVDSRSTRHDPFSLVCDGVDECIKAVRHQLRVGADFVKICTGDVQPPDFRGECPDIPEFSMEEINAIVRTAADCGMFVAAHNEGSLIGMKRSILGGVKTIEHCVMVDQECAELAKQNGTIFVSTFEILRRLAAAEVTSEFRYAQKRFGPWAEALFESHKRIHRTGAVLAMGSDYPWARFSMPASELEALVKYCDFTPMEAIVAATKNGAMACFMGDKTGTIEPGKFADIIIVDGNPLADIKILQDVTKIKMVMLEGKIEVTR